MALIPYQSKEQIHTAGDPGAVAQRRGAGEFLSAGENRWPDALARLAHGLGRLGDAIHVEDIRRKEEAFQLELIQDVNSYKAASQKFYDDFTQEYQGENAAGAEQVFAGWHRERLGELTAKWKDNSRAQLYLAQHAADIGIGGVNAGRDYGNQQFEGWKDSVMMGDQTEFTQFASDPNRSPDEIRREYRSFGRRQAGYYQSKGLDPRSAQAKADEIFREGVRANVMSRVAQLSQTDPDEAARIIQGRPRSAQLPPAVAGLAEREAAAQGVDPALVMAVIGAESGGKAEAVSKAGAVGLMQLMPGTALDLGVTDPANPEQNVRGGVKYLKQLLGRYNGNKTLALMAYNAGMGNVDEYAKTGRFLKTPKNPNGEVFGETREYVRRIRADYRMRAGGGQSGGQGQGGRLARPLAGNVRISSGFGRRSAPQTPNGPGSSNHQGIDYAVPVGTPVTSAGAGTVAFVGRNGGYGLQVRIDHGDGTESWYSHLSDTGGLKQGDAVGQGQQVALSGGAKGDPNAGKSTGPHLDFKVKKNGEFVDPEALFQGGDSEPGGEDKPVMVASLGPGVAETGEVMSDAYGVASETAPASAEPADGWDDGDDWMLGDDAALIAKYFSPEERAEMMGQLDKTQDHKLVEKMTGGIADAFQNGSEVDVASSISQAFGEIKKVGDPDRQNAIAKSLQQNIAVQQTARDAADMEATENFWAQAQTENWTPLETQQRLKDAPGFSRDAKATLAKKLEDGTANKVTPENQVAYDSARVMVDERRNAGQPMSTEELRAMAQQGGMTVTQAKDLEKYRTEGGIAGQSGLAGKVNEVYKTLTGGKKGAPAGFVDMVARNLPPGKAATPDEIRKATATLLLANVKGESIGKGFLGFDRGETYAEAAKAGRAEYWLPDIADDEEKAELTLLVQGEIESGRFPDEPIDDEVLRDYKRVFVQGLPPRPNSGAAPSRGANLTNLQSNLGR